MFNTYNKKSNLQELLNAPEDEEGKSSVDFSKTHNSLVSSLKMLSLKKTDNSSMIKYGSFSSSFSDESQEESQKNSGKYQNSKIGIKQFSFKVFKEICPSTDTKSTANTKNLQSSKAQSMLSSSNFNEDAPTTFHSLDEPLSLKLNGSK